MNGEQQLSKLRDQIDLCDQELIDILVKRAGFVAEVGKVKSTYGLPIYVPEREQAMLSKRRDEAQNKGLNPELIEDILRRVMRESYSSENDHGFKCVNTDIKKIVIVGGNGKLGGLFARYFRSSGYTVAILDVDDWDNVTEIMQDAKLVIVSVPIDLTCQTIAKLEPFLNEDMLLVDFTSVKTAPINAMLKHHKGAVVGLHPMFGPDIKNFAKQVIVCCAGRDSEKAQWLLQQFSIWGAKICKVNCFDHDHSMSYIQALRHFATFVNGLHLARQNIRLDTILELSSPIYRLELMMIGRLFAQDANLYADIIMDKDENIAVINSLQQAFDQALKIIQNKDKDEFMATFNMVKNWFGDYANSFLNESRQILEQASDQRNR